MSYVKEVHHIPEPDYTKPTEFLALGIFKDKGLQDSHRAVDAVLDGLIGKILEAKDFKGKKGDTLLLFTGS
ncbi:MAG: hypothetical protein JSU61_05940, partial [Fidelibacterota bacterium]